MVKTAKFWGEKPAWLDDDGGFIGSHGDDFPSRTGKKGAPTQKEIREIKNKRLQKGKTSA